MFFFLCANVSCRRFSQGCFFPTIMDVENHHFGLEDDCYFNVCRHSLKTAIGFIEFQTMFKCVAFLRFVYGFCCSNVVKTKPGHVGILGRQHILRKAWTFSWFYIRIYIYIYIICVVCVHFHLPAGNRRNTCIIYIYTHVSLNGKGMKRLTERSFETNGNLSGFYWCTVAGSLTFCIILPCCFLWNILQVHAVFTLMNM